MRFLLLVLLSLSAVAQSRELEVQIVNGDVTLAGTLLLPDSHGPVPAIVLVHGSGPESREPLRQFAVRFQKLGIAALVYDKRGVGKSTGAWYRASLDDLAQDALAATRLLKARTEVDPARVGIWGISQGGWVILRANVLDPKAFAFAIAVTGGGTKPVDVERYDYEARMRHMQLTPEQHAHGQKTVADYLDYLGSMVPRAQIEADLTQYKDEPWAQAFNISRILPDEGDKALWSWVRNYDPVPDMAKVKFPIMVLLGGKDRPELSATELNNWKTGLEGNPTATLLLSTGAAHGMAQGQHHPPGAQQQFVPEYLDMVDAWLRSRSLAR